MVARTAFRIFVVDEDGNRNFPYLNQDDTRWNVNWNWLDNGFNPDGRVAVSGNLQQMEISNAR